jgi:hypothetical protein
MKHKVITIEKAMGRIKRYFQLTPVMAAKQSANAQQCLVLCKLLILNLPLFCHGQQR